MSSYKRSPEAAKRAQIAQLKGRIAGEQMKMIDARERKEALRLELKTMQGKK